MNPNKICFIYQVKNEILYKESLRYLQSLHISDEFEVELLECRENDQVLKAYNEAMLSSDAKYKVYIRDNVFVINKYFIDDMLALFNNNPQLGMLGILGAKTPPLSGNWKDSNHKFGKVIENSTGAVQLISFNEVETNYESVCLLDGMIVATQFDIPWREDLFKSESLIGESQSLEFLKAGFEVGVPAQIKPWCSLVNNKPNNGGSEDKKTFLKEYSNLLFPKVSVLIPTYNRPQYFEQSLQSVLSQTYQHIEIVVCDDSTNDETKALMENYLESYPQIRYYKNERNLGQFQNDLKCLELADGNYVNFLMDDDLFHPQKIEKMMEYYLGDDGEDITLVTSHRELIDRDGNVLPDQALTKRMFDEDTIVLGNELANTALAYNWNFIGEPTTVLFRKSDLVEPFGVFFDREYQCNVDMATWLTLLSQGKGMYISQTLSYFRIHDDQQLQSNKMKLLGAADYAHEIVFAQKKGFLLNEKDYELAVRNCCSYVEKVISTIDDETKEFPQYNELLHLLDELKRLLTLVGKYGQLEKEATLLVCELPLVSVLIPAYNRPRMLEEALQSVLNQTYKNIEIIICDDSTNDEVEKMIQPYLSEYNHIQYYKNEKNLGLGNIYKCFDKAQGEFINYLMDDDLFHKEKIEKMVNYLIQYPDVTLVTSQRIRIDEAGNILPTNEKFFEKDTIIDGITIGNYILENNRNIIGEPTTAMFRRKDLIEKFGNYKNIEYSVINDVAAWISLLSKGKLLYISEELSYFRQHKNQNQRNPELLYLNINQWFDLITSSREDGFLQIENQYMKALNKYLKVSLEIMDLYNSINQKDILKLHKVHEKCSAAMKLLTDYQDYYICPFCENRFRSMNAWPDKYDTDMKFEMYNKHSICPVCISLDRERLYRVYLQRKTDLLYTNKSVLHIAPERNLKNWLSSISNIEYICGDLYPNDPTIIKMDITRIPYPDDHFNVILCSHVLEHIPNDRAAMKELLRVLKPGGWGIVQVPIAIELEKTFEDPSVVTPEERFRIFGQEDHVRIYGRDYIDRLKEVGFEVEIFNLADKYGQEEAMRYGLSETSNLYIVHKREK